MFDNLSDRLGGVLQKLKGQNRLTDENIKETLREVRRALLEADVALSVVQDFINQIRTRAEGQEVLESLSPGQMLIKVVHEELVRVMGERNEALDLAATPPAVILMAGLQGAGKTTTVAKLARFLKERTDKTKIMVSSCDVYRPAAIEQLATLAQEVEVEFHPSDPSQKPVAIAKSALAAAKNSFMDVLIVDTAGRLHIDEDMMQEIKELHGALHPIETLFVVDSMTGQDAANSARAFNDALPLSGIVLTKTDGDARGGAALSIRHITGKPIKFIGVGEKTTALEAFYPDRIASRILGMGDVLSLIEDVQRKVDIKKAEKLSKKLKKGKAFTLADLQDQLLQMREMGGMEELMAKMPGMNNVPQQMKSQVNDVEIRRMIAIINSMTPNERRFPAVIKGSRKRRIANGSGTQIHDINKLMKQFNQMQRMMKKVSKVGGMKKLMRGMRGQLPPGVAS